MLMLKATQLHASMLRKRQFTIDIWQGLLGIHARGIDALFPKGLSHKHYLFNEQANPRIEVQALVLNTNHSS